MQSFEEFQKSRLAMDPTSRQLTDLQWEQAYEAHKSSRQRVTGSRSRRSERSSKSRKQSSSGSNRSSSDGSRQRRKRSSSSAPAIRSTSASLTKSGLVLWRVREASAYGDVRLLVNLLAYFLLALVVIGVGIKVSLFTGVAAAVTVILEGLLKVAAIFVLRYLAHVLIDIPDIMLFQELQESDSSGEEIATESTVDIEPS